MDRENITKKIDQLIQEVGDKYHQFIYYLVI